MHACAGARGLLDVRGLDLQPLMQALEDPAAPPGAADAATAPAAGPPDPATGLPAPMPARLRGQLKLWMNERGSDGAADSSGVGDGSAAGGRGVSYDGSMELQGLRVNQMQLAHGLKGDFSVDDGRFQLDADGFWAYEKLRVDLNFAGLGMLERLASLEGLLGEGGLEGSGGRVAEGPANEMLLGPRRARAGGSLLELQHGNMKVSASVDGAMEQVRAMFAEVCAQAEWDSVLCSRTVSLHVATPGHNRGRLNRGGCSNGVHAYVFGRMRQQIRAFCLVHAVAGSVCCGGSGLRPRRAGRHGWQRQSARWHS